MHQAHGGRDDLYESLTTEQAAALQCRIEEAIAWGEAKAEEADRQARLDLQDRDVQRQLAETAIAWLADHPDELAPHLPSILRSRPALLDAGLLAEPQLRGRLTKLGWTPPADEVIAEQGEVIDLRQWCTIAERARLEGVDQGVIRKQADAGEILDRRILGRRLVPRPE